VEDYEARREGNWRRGAGGNFVKNLIEPRLKRRKKRAENDQHGEKNGPGVSENLSRSDKRNCYDGLENDNAEQEFHATADGYDGKITTVPSGAGKPTSA
jgi:hypothetical protein